MIPTILEIVACIIAAVNGFIGIIYSLNSINEYAILLFIISGLLIFNIFCYLMSSSDLMQKGIKDNQMGIFISRMLYKSIYGIFALQIIAITFMVQ